MENDSGTNQIIASVRSGEKPKLRLALLIFVSTALTHLTGGSAGREGAALQIGGSLAATLGKALRLDERNLNLIVLCGMSALFTALFGTPVAATVFSLEVVSVGIVHYSALFPALLSSLVSLGVTRLLGVEGENWALTGAPAVSIEALIRTGALALLCALLSMAFCVLMHRTAHLYQKYIPNQYLRVVVGGLLIIALTLLEGSRDYNGAGGALITLALSGTVHVPWAFLLKLIFTALTLGAGFRGGEIVPTFFIGSTFGCAVAPLLGLEPSYGAAIGLISLFCAVVNCPLASLLLSVELFGSDSLWFFALACSLSYLFSGKYSLYSSQKIIYSKFEPRFIDANAH
jgi:H+/Cl- antiporter ClcA